MGEILKGGWSGDNCVWGGEVAKDEATERGRCWALEGPRGQIKDGGLYAKVSGKPQSHFQQESREEAGRRVGGLHLDRVAALEVFADYFRTSLMGPVDGSHKGPQERQC